MNQKQRVGSSRSGCALFVLCFLALASCRSQLPQASGIAPTQPVAAVQDTAGERSPGFDSIKNLSASVLQPGPGSRAIHLLSPAANQQFLPGDTVDIRWSSTGIDKVIIIWERVSASGLAAEKNGWISSPSVRTMAGHEIPNRNSFAWKIPAGFKDGNYVVQVFNHDPTTPGAGGTYAGFPVAKSAVFRILNPEVSLEQSGSGLRVNIVSEGIGLTHKLTVKNRGFFTDLPAQPTRISELTSQASFVQVPIQKEGLYLVQLQSCISKNGTSACLPVREEEIYIVSDRDAVVPNWNVTWKIPVKGVDFPADALVSEEKFCKTATARGCVALSREIFSNHRGGQRYIKVPDGTGPEDKPYLGLYEAYGPPESYLRRIQKYYSQPGMDDRFLREVLQGVIDSADFTTLKDTSRMFVGGESPERLDFNGRMFMVVRDAPGIHGETGTNARVLKMLGRYLNNAVQPDNPGYRYRWTLLSLFRMLSRAFLVDYDYERGGLRSKVEPDNVRTKKVYIDNFLLSFPGGFVYDKRTKTIAARDPQVALGKSVQAMRDIFHISWKELLVPNLKRFSGIDMSAEHGNMLAFGKGAVGRLGGVPKRSNFNVASFFEAVKSDEEGLIPYAFKLRDADFNTEDPNGRFIELSKATTITKACGGFGGYLLNGSEFSEMSDSDIGQLMGFYWMLYDADLDDNSSIPGRKSFNPNLRKGWAHELCPDGAQVEEGQTCQSVLERMNGYYEQWRDRCCKLVEDNVCVRNKSGQYVRIGVLSDSEKNTYEAYPGYCRNL